MGYIGLNELNGLNELHVCEHSGLAKSGSSGFIMAAATDARVAELADALDSGSSE